MNIYAGMNLTLLCVRQGEVSIRVPIYEEDNTLSLAYQCERMDQMLLKSTGMVLPSRTWWIERPGTG